jgi:hypothetical protein
MTDKSKMANRGKSITGESSGTEGVGVEGAIVVVAFSEILIV